MFPLRSAMVVVLLSASLSAAQEKPKPAPAKQKPKPPPAAFQGLLKSTPDEFIQRFDRNKDGVLSKDELPGQLSAALERADRNNDGKLDKQEVGEMLALLRKRFGQPPPAPDQRQIEQAVRDLLQRQDTNKDGKISKDEAMGPVAQAFARADSNNDGFLDRDELRRIAARFVQFSGPGKPRPPGARGAIPDFDAFDQNADGRLTADEVKQAPFAQRFAEMDANKDGKVDRKEFEGFYRNQPPKP